MSMETTKVKKADFFQIVSVNGTGVMTNGRGELKIAPLEIAKPPEQNLEYEVKYTFESVPAGESVASLNRSFRAPTFMSAADRNGKELWKKEVESIEFSDAPDNKVNIEVTFITEDVSNLL